MLMLEGGGGGGGLVGSFPETYNDPIPDFLKQNVDVVKEINSI